jgi:hypothetical protein
MDTWSTTFTIHGLDEEPPVDSHSSTGSYSR